MTSPAKSVEKTPDEVAKLAAEFAMENGRREVIGSNPPRKHKRPDPNLYWGLEQGFIAGWWTAESARNVCKHSDTLNPAPEGQLPTCKLCGDGINPFAGFFKKESTMEHKETIEIHAHEYACHEYEKKPDFEPEDLEKAFIAGAGTQAGLSARPDNRVAELEETLIRFWEAAPDPGEVADHPDYAELYRKAPAVWKAQHDKQGEKP